MLNFAMPLYEAKYQAEDEWVEISDIEIMDELYKTFTKATPAIKEMIMGKEIETPYRIYRLELIGGEHHELSAA
jgi:predicted alternative tryptophan synthase beta-subunit